MAAPPASASAATTRQRAGSKAASASRQASSQQQQAGAAASTSSAPASVLSTANFYIAQHVGLVLCVLGIGALAAGYDRGWVHNTTLTLLSLSVCLVGLCFHELRPFNAQTLMEEQQKASSAAAR